MMQNDIIDDERSDVSLFCSMSDKTGCFITDDINLRQNSDQSLIFAFFVCASKR